MFVVVKATELDRVTEKNIYPPEKAALGVREGSEPVVLNADTEWDLERCMALTLYNEDEGYIFTTPSIFDVSKDGDLYLVKTKDTVYFIEEREDDE